MAESHPRFSNLDLVNQVDGFPNISTHPALHARQLSTLSHFTHGAHTLGYLLPQVVAVLKDCALSGPHWVFSGNTVSLTGTTPAERSALMATTLAAWRAAGTFSVLKGWRDEMYTVYAPASQPLLHMERSACALFGVVTYGAHLTAYTLSPAGDIHIWTPRRNPAKQTYGGLLDNTVAGGMSAGLTPLETIVKEASEEASLDEKFVRESVRSVGAVSYFYCRHKTAGGEEGLLQPEVQYCYDLLLVDDDVVPVPGDDEVLEFRLWDVSTVKEELAKGSFKPNCALVLIDFFIRHGLLTPENEPDYIEIMARLHRRFEFPTR